MLIAFSFFEFGSIVNGLLIDLALAWYFAAPFLIGLGMEPSETRMSPKEARHSATLPELTTESLLSVLLVAAFSFRLVALMGPTLAALAGTAMVAGVVALFWAPYRRHFAPLPAQ
jgi:hypothetical protein